MPETRKTDEVWRGLSDELGQFELSALRTEGERASATIAGGIQRYGPSGLVLMNNSTVEGYRRLQSVSQHTAFPPAVIVMSSFLEGTPARLRVTTGISYEVPSITVVTNLRKLVATRPWLPTIVGAASLVSPNQSFDTFAVLPDRTALGTQAASLVLDIADNGWSLPSAATTQLPLSTTTTVDLKQARERCARAHWRKSTRSWSGNGAHYQ